MAVFHSIALVLLLLSDVSAIRIDSFHRSRTVKCGDSVHGIWPMETLSFRLDLSSDVRSIEISSCSSTIDTNLRLYGQASSTPLIADDNGCGNLFGSAFISIPDGLPPGEYPLELSADPLQQDGEYDLRIICNALNSEVGGTNLEGTISLNPNHKRIPLGCDSETLCHGITSELLYFGALNEYNTDYMYYDTAQRRRLSPQNVGCYTFKITNNGMCTDNVHGFVLGLCTDDIPHFDASTLDTLIVDEFKEGIYSGYSDDQITGILVDVPIRSDPVEITLCLNGVNLNGNTSDSVQFRRASNSEVLCNSMNSMGSNHVGLPCFLSSISKKYTASGPIAQGRDGVHYPHGLMQFNSMADPINKLPIKPSGNNVVSRILFAVFVVMLMLMAGVAVFYYLVVIQQKFKIAATAAQYIAHSSSIDTHFNSGSGSSMTSSSMSSSAASSSESSDDMESEEASVLSEFHQEDLHRVDPEYHENAKYIVGSELSEEDEKMETQEIQETNAPKLTPTPSPLNGPSHDVIMENAQNAEETEGPSNAQQHAQEHEAVEVLSVNLPESPDGMKHERGGTQNRSRNQSIGLVFCIFLCFHSVLFCTF